MKKEYRRVYCKLCGRSYQFYYFPKHMCKGEKTENAMESGWFETVAKSHLERFVGIVTWAKRKSEETGYKVNVERLLTIARR